MQLKPKFIILWFIYTLRIKQQSLPSSGEGKASLFFICIYTQRQLYQSAMDVQTVKISKTVKIWEWRLFLAQSKNLLRELRKQCVLIIQLFGQLFTHHISQRAGGGSSLH